ncbi:unnamed protein product [Lactuca saligna]|uniref:Uncharacterized protein n=1 Tax=Lactuca saligna TaxID=75948 RepID=A0AA35YJ64_LACSI|nr:unnamed protein product [Lactuca saligna]
MSSFKRTCRLTTQHCHRHHPNGPAGSQYITNIAIIQMDISNFRLLLAQLLNCRSKKREGGHFGHTAAEFVHQKEERLEATSMVFSSSSVYVKSSNPQHVFLIILVNELVIFSLNRKLSSAASCYMVTLISKCVSKGDFLMPCVSDDL